MLLAVFNSIQYNVTSDNSGKYRQELCCQWTTTCDHLRQTRKLHQFSWSHRRTWTLLQYLMWQHHRFGSAAVSTKCQFHCSMFATNCQIKCKMIKFWTELKLFLITLLHLPSHQCLFIYYLLWKSYTKYKKQKKSAKRCKVLVCAQANNELFNVTESKVI